MDEGWHVAHLRRLLGEVAARYADILDADDHAFIATFDALTPPARSLCARLLTRRGPVFRRTQLQYTDVPDTDRALDELLHRKVCTPVTAFDDDCLRISRRQELAEWFGLPPRATRRDLELRLRESSAPRPLPAHDRWVRTGLHARIRRFELCQFGNSRQRLAEFVISELGHLRYPVYPLDAHCRFFHDRQHLQDTETLLRIREVMESTPLEPETLVALHAALPESGHDARYARRRSRVIFQLARAMERAGKQDSALEWYRESGSDPALERLVQLSLRRRDVTTAVVWMQRLQASADPEYQERAAHWLRRHAPALAPVRHEPATAHMRMVKPDGPIERAVAAALTTGADACFHVENAWIQSLFGLWFWEEIFSDIPGAFGHAYQRAPLDMFDPEFAPRRYAAVEARLKALHRADRQARFDAVHAHHHGETNAWVHWEMLDRLPWRAMLEAMPSVHLEMIFRQLLVHPGHYRSGFPDLFLVTEHGAYRWIEVKGPHDTLRPHQRVWLSFFEAHGIDAQVLHVEFQPDSHA